MPKSKSNNSYGFSQNFLTSKGIIERIVNLSSISKGDTVIEIGTGKGHLSGVLCEKCSFLFSIEIDEVLYDRSKTRLKEYDNIRLINEDFLKYELPRKEKYKVFANIPFSITTRIIDKLTGASNPPDEMWLVVEKGAAKRFMGRAKENIKSLLLKPYWEMEVKYNFRKDDFHPRPLIDSVLLHLSRKHTPDIDRTEYRMYKKFVEQSVKYGIFSKRSLLTKKQINAALKTAKLPPVTEDGVILYVQWLCLFRYYMKFNRFNSRADFQGQDSFSVNPLPVD